MNGAASYFSDGCPAGESRNQTAKKMTHTAPSAPKTQNGARHPASEDSKVPAQLVTTIIVVLRMIVAKCEFWGAEENLLRLRDARHFTEWFGRLRDRDEVPFPLGAQLHAETDALEACIAEHGVNVNTALLSEARQARAAIARIIRQLNIDGSSTDRARTAANARWSKRA